ncbi:MAG: MFS transporter [Rikenellaceae bacterium]
MRAKNQLYKNSRYTVSVYFFMQGIIFATWASRIPDIKSALALSEAALGGILFAIPVGQISAMALSAWAVNRFSSWNALLVAAILSPLSLIPIGLSSSPFMLSFSLLFFGITCNLFNISVNTQGVDVERVFSKNIMATFHGLWSLGGFTGGVLSMILAAIDINYLEHFIALAAVMIICGMSFRRGLMPRDVKPEGQKSVEQRRNILQRLDGYIILLGVMAFGAMMCEGTMFDWSGVYFADVVAAPDNLIRLGYIICMCTMTIGRFLSDRMVARFGAARVVCASGILIASGLLLSVLFPSIAIASIGFFCIGFGISSTVPICYSMAGRSKSISPGTALASVSTIGYLGFLIGPPLIGFCAELISLRWTFAVIAMAGLSISLLSRALKQYE